MRASFHRPILRLLRSVRTPLRMAAAAVVLLCLIAAGFQGDWSLGRFTLTRGPASAPLELSATAAQFVSTSFLTDVGGVAFIETAEPDSSVAGLPVRLDYDARQADGRRLRVTVGNDVYHPELFDWQLVPISNFASSDYNAVVSLFGGQSTSSFFEARFHHAFENTLLGMRLLQGDMLWMLDGDVAELPRYGGELVLGRGERRPNHATAEVAMDRVGADVENGEPDSWVLTDRDESIRFGVSDARLVITGEPYYYFWRYSKRGAAIEDSLFVAVTRYGLMHERSDSLTVARLEEEMDRFGTEPLDDLTEAVRQKGVAVRALNPAVYDAAANTMQFAAFFRWVRATDPIGWNRFRAQLAAVNPQPIVHTPNRVPHGL